jgi:hypothetical protein
MKLLKLATLCLLCICVSTTLHAQHEPDNSSGEKGFDKSKLFFGGNFGFSFGSYNTFVNVSPQLGYRFNKYLAAGVGINGQYYSYNDGVGKNQYGIAGLNVFGRFYPIPQLFLQVQPEANYTWGKYIFNNNEQPTQTIQSEVRPALLVGAGGVIPMGAGGSGIIIMVQYDLLGEYNMPPYGNKPFFSFGVNFGL